MIKATGRCLYLFRNLSLLYSNERKTWFLPYRSDSLRGLDSRGDNLRSQRQSQSLLQRYK